MTSSQDYAINAPRRENYLRLQSAEVDMMRAVRDQLVDGSMQVDEMIRGMACKPGWQRTS